MYVVGATFNQTGISYNKLGKLGYTFFLNENTITMV